jgi:osmoprotectant transport system substrate-binding protein
MRRSSMLATVMSLFVLLSACGVGGGDKPEIRIGSDDFYESAVVAEMFAQVLEANGYTVTRNLNIGARQVRAPAMESGQIDLTPEYVGSGLGFYDPSKISGDGQQNRDALATLLEAKGISVFGISPGEDTNAFVVRKDTADQYSLTKISDLVAVEGELTWGLPAECDENPLCKGALEQYGLTYPPANRESLGACSAPMAEALNGNAIDVAELCSTQPAIAQFGFVALEDDLDTQPAENMTALIRDDYFDKITDKAAFQKLLDDVLAKLTTEELTKLGVEIVINTRDVDEVATEFLKANGLLPAS